MVLKQTLSKLAFWLTVALLVFLPLSPFLVTVTGLRFISLTREILIFLLFLAAFLKRRQDKIPWIKDDLEQLVLWLFVLATLSLVFVTQDFSAFLWSARYSLTPLVLFWSLHSFSFKKEEVSTLLNSWLFFAAGLTIIGIIFTTVIPKQTLLDWGYSPYVAVGNGQWVASATLPAYQTVAGSIPRLQSTLSGPIQFAGFTLLALLLLPSLSIKQRQSWYWPLFILLLGGVAGSFSRAAWLALAIVGLWLGLKQLLKKGWKKSEILAVVIILLVAFFSTVGLYLNRPNAEDRRQLVANIFTRDVSDREHVRSLTQSLQEWREIGITGLGFGRSGAGSIQNSSLNPSAPAPRFVDNSYLRWYEELGPLGALVFLALIYSLLVELSHLTDKNARLLGWAGTALALTAIFTDMWLEAVPVITFFAFAGLLHQTKTYPANPESLDLNGIQLSRRSFVDTSKLLASWADQTVPHHIITLNPEMMINAGTNPKLETAIKNAHLVTADGAGILAAAHVSNRRKSHYAWLNWLLYICYWIQAGWLLLFMPKSLQPRLERVTGSDLTRFILNDANQRELKLALLGSTEAVIKKAKERIKQDFPKIRLVLAESGPNWAERGGIAPDVARPLVSRLHHAKPHYLLVAFGVPNQEIFLNKYGQEIGAPVMIGVSGAFDSVLAGTVRRAPIFLQKLNLEWLWRMLLQPKRAHRIWTAVVRFPFTLTRHLVK